MRIPLIVLLAILTCHVSWAQTKRPSPVVQTIASGTVWRESPVQDAAATSERKWKQITITNIFGFSRRPVVGDSVSVIALGAEMEPLSLRILKAQHKDNACDKRLAGEWEVELESITSSKFFQTTTPGDRSVDYPFDVVILYPAVKTARQLDKKQLARDALPRGVMTNTIKAAIDLDEDRKPDILVLEYCCLNPKQSTKECDYTCGKTYKKMNNTWRIVRTSAPC